jgi:hypothetical protein
MTQELFDAHLQSDWAMVVPPTFKFHTVSPTAKTCTLIAETKNLSGKPLALSLGVTYTSKENIQSAFEQAMAQHHIMLPTPQHYEKTIDTLFEVLSKLDLNLPSLEVPL